MPWFVDQIDKIWLTTKTAQISWKKHVAPVNFV